MKYVSYENRLHSLKEQRRCWCIMTTDVRILKIEIHFNANNFVRAFSVSARSGKKNQIRLNSTKMNF